MVSVFSKCTDEETGALRTNSKGTVLHGPRAQETKGQRLRQSQPAVLSEFQTNQGRLRCRTLRKQSKPASEMLSQESQFQSLKASEVFVGQAIL